MTDDTAPEIEVVTPQFDRPDADDSVVFSAPADAEGFATLRQLSREELVNLGLQSWDGSLLLFPAEWYRHIPEGFEVTTISGETAPFDRDKHSNDRRFGALAYGIEVDE